MKIFLFYSVFILLFLSSLTSVLAIEITSCSSGSVDGICEIDRACTCRISGECTNGNLLLYQVSLTNPLCSPQIVGNSVSINPDYCEFTEGVLYAIADCDEGQSLQKTIMISQVETTIATTTMITTVPTTTTVTETTEPPTHECFGGKGYCEDIMAKCQEGWVYCPEHNDECPESDEICCCQETEPGGVIPKFNFKLVTFIVLAVVIGIVLFLFFITQTKRGMSFEKLYKKWNK